MAYDEALADRVREVLEILEPGGAVTSKKMFGGIGFMIQGNMAVGVSGQGGLMLRVPPEQTDELAAREHTRPFEMRGKAMAGWLRVDADGVEDDDQLRGVGRDRRRPRAHDAAQVAALGLRPGPDRPRRSPA